MTLGMQRQMARVTAALAVVLGVGALGCGHRAATNPPQIAALQPPTPMPPGPDYQIQIGDELHVRFMYQPDQNEQMPVRPDGRISLLSTGELEVVGLTPTQLEKLIVEKSSAHLRNPEVTVIVTKVGDRRVYVGGEVERAGYVLIQPGMTPLQAIMQSGGFKPTAKLESVLLITPTADGKFSAARVDMRQVVEDGVPERLRLHTNDIVFVPRTWIADIDIAVDQYVRGLFPALPRVGAGYSL
jgi:protein involved in polysaccharide export with SLBB domain